jgi:hypothetical protein
LRQLFWSADVFVNPSIQPDKDFGVTPRQAMACGVPVVTSNFAGLAPLARDMPWKGLDSYSTLYGSRFSLKQLRRLLQRALRGGDKAYGEFSRDAVLKECNPALLRKNLQAALDWLVQCPPEVALSLEGSKRKLEKRLLENIDVASIRYLSTYKKGKPPGTTVFGDDLVDCSFPMVQSLYSAKPASPRVEKNTLWRGFFRLGLWEREHALVEFGYPGPRMRYYGRDDWQTLSRCARFFRGEYFFTPSSERECLLIQELVDLGYLVA